MFLIYGGNGWIGQKIVKILQDTGKEFIVSEERADNIKAVEEEISRVKPSNVICLLGRTHGTYEGEYIPTIDYLEKKGKIKENVRDNLFCPIALALLCQKRFIHLTYLGTGCIFNYQDDKVIFTEEDEPNFFGSSYSVVKGYTDRLMHMFNNVLNVRIRMPISSDKSPRNFIAKLLKYKKICSMQNSMTVLDELLPIMCHMAEKKEVGTVNLTNPGTIEHSEILDMYREIIEPNFTYEVFSYEEQMKVIACDRSNNELDTSLLKSKYKVKNIKDSVRDILSKFKEELSGFYCISDEDHVFICGKEFGIPPHYGIMSLVKTFKDTYCDILSPVVVSKTGKVIYYGGVICRNEVIFIDESFVNISQTSDLTSPFNYVKPTMLFYPRYFIMKRELFNKFNPMKPNFEDYMEYNIRVTPFIHAEQQINFTTKYDNILSVRGFEFEKECVLENIRVNYQQGNFPLKVQPVKFIDGSARKHVLIIEWEVLTPDKDCGSLYMINFIRLLMANNYIVHFIPVNLAYRKKYTYDLQSMGVYVAHTTLSVKDYLVINCNVYDIIVVSRIREIKSFYDDIRLYCPKAKLVFNTVDLNFIRNKRENELTCINEQTIDPVEVDEISYIQRSDLALVVSDYEYTYLKKKNIDVVHFPICYQVSNLTRETDTSGLYFIGSRHTPNIDAINYFLKYIYGSILEIQNVPMYIFGECCIQIEPVLVEKYKGNITVINSIEDDVLAAFLKRVRVNLVPLRYGAGVKGKLLQASNNGVPSISTSIGIEGTEFKHMKDVLVLNIDDADYAQKFVSYYNDTALLTNIAENARETFRSNYSLETGNTHMIKLNDRLEKIQIKKHKLCILFNTYNKPYVAKLLKDYIDNIIGSYDFYIINNGPEKLDDTYSDFIEIKGDNTVNEFSGIQCAIDKLIEEKRIETYDAFCICNDTIASNYPLNHIYKISRAMIDTVFRSRTVKGHTDSFGQIMYLDNFSFDSWYRSFFLLINKNLFKDMGYRFMNYRVENIYDGDTMKINISKELKSRLENWLSQERYRGADMRKKYMCIFNEYRFSHEVRKVLKGI